MIMVSVLFGCCSSLVWLQFCLRIFMARAEGKDTCPHIHSSGQRLSLRKLSRPSEWWYHDSNLRLLTNPRLDVMQLHQTMILYYILIWPELLVASLFWLKLKVCIAKGCPFQPSALLNLDCAIPSLHSEHQELRRTSLMSKLSQVCAHLSFWNLFKILTWKWHKCLTGRTGDPLTATIPFSLVLVGPLLHLLRNRNCFTAHVLKSASRFLFDIAY